MAKMIMGSIVTMGTIVVTAVMLQPITVADLHPPHHVTLIHITTISNNLTTSHLIIGPGIQLENLAHLVGILERDLGATAGLLHIIGHAVLCQLKRIMTAIEKEKVTRGHTDIIVLGLAVGKIHLRNGPNQ